mgnify:CR=1 FL=1
MQDYAARAAADVMQMGGSLINFKGLGLEQFQASNFLRFETETGLSATAAHLLAEADATVGIDPHEATFDGAATGPTQTHAEHAVLLRVALQARQGEALATIQRRTCARQLRRLFRDSRLARLGTPRLGQRGIVVALYPPTQRTLLQHQRQILLGDGRLAELEADHLALFGDTEASVHRAWRLREDRRMGRAARALLLARAGDPAPLIARILDLARTGLV